MHRECSQSVANLGLAPRWAPINGHVFGGRYAVDAGVRTWANVGNVGANDGCSEECCVTPVAQRGQRGSRTIQIAMPLGVSGATSGDGQLQSRRANAKRPRTRPHYARGSKQYAASAAKDAVSSKRSRDGEGLPYRPQFRCDLPDIGWSNRCHIAMALLCRSDEHRA